MYTIFYSVAQNFCSKWQIIVEMNYVSGWNRIYPHTYFSLPWLPNCKRLGGGSSFTQFSWNIYTFKAFLILNMFFFKPGFIWFFQKGCTKLSGYDIVHLQRSCWYQFSIYEYLIAITYTIEKLLESFFKKPFYPFLPYT